MNSRGCSWAESMPGKLESFLLPLQIQVSHRVRAPPSAQFSSVQLLSRV